MKLFVGLGNPGQKYAGNRHNVGFMALDSIADHAGLGAWRKRFHGLTCDGELGGERVLLLKPQTYYNEAGRSVREAAKFLKIKVGDIIVFHDEIDLAPGKLRVKTGGGLAGNNGLRSISSHLGPDFIRVRVGVGHPGDKNQVANYVLRDFAKADNDWLSVLLHSVARSADRLAAGETERFQTDIAQALNDARSNEPLPDKKTNPRAQEQAQRPSPGSSATVPKKGASSIAKPAAKRSGPSQLELAKKASTSRKKPSRRIKKGITAADTAQQPASQDVQQAEPASSDTALAARLKRWLTGGTSET